MKKIKLKIVGMHCSSCAMNIDGELEDLGVKKAETNFAKQETKVEFDENIVTVPQMVEAILRLGYSAQPIE